ncbi:Hypothetical protein ERS075645_04788 [Mycobacteroides abscessus]|nr:Hypothetical protein ERS075645_04788 [Mycobacteroides abscessus]
MSEFLRVPPEQMRHEAAQLHSIAQELKNTHQNAHGQMADLLAGFGETGLDLSLEHGWSNGKTRPIPTIST